MAIDANSLYCSDRRTNSGGTCPLASPFELNGEIYGIPRPELNRKVDELSELLQVRHKLNVSVRELSPG